MGRLILFLLVAAGMFAVGYYVINGGFEPRARTEASAPKQTLDNVRKAAKRIEADDAKRADDALKHAVENQ